MEQIIKLGETILLNESKANVASIGEENSFNSIAVSMGKSPASKQIQSPARDLKKAADYSINRRSHEKLNFTQNSPSFVADSPNDGSINPPSQKATLLGDDSHSRVRNENRKRFSTPGNFTVSPEYSNDFDPPFLIHTFFTAEKSEYIFY